jgi:hypothetical protein
MVQIWLSLWTWSSALVSTRCHCRPRISLLSRSRPGRPCSSLLCGLAQWRSLLAWCPEEMG